MAFRLVHADYHDPAHGAALVEMLSIYARDPMGGGEDLSEAAKANLIAGLQQTPHAFSILIFDGDRAVALANCIYGFSTFAAKKIINIHDMVVHPDYRGQGLGKMMFDEIELMAKQSGASKVTLEVLEGNEAAKGLYASLGYGDYVLDPKMGRALFWQKAI
ncbi:GNAT family N-acetyltransferase [Sphingorhabdus lutea]|uniref:GNAT family N-acetyltransferase n=1 Tax=Sphingorhabdus lutea TaxID=1913578 RepID=A0A1L3J9L6_9SPHN|nr:GNAT family N-acetyltransferase [Sphingorhabdus lutea]APG61819.1 GNAT family N-acetyltransferase [Sphingorhabdus lutea]